MKANILVVDDNPLNVRLLRRVLTEQGYQVETAHDGAKALEVVRSALPDLILLDIMMPELNGYQVCERLKEQEATSEIPIIFISALGEIEDKVQAFTAGGVDYITKPIQFEEVIARVQTHLSLRELQKQLQQANQELARRLKQLEARNEELDAFAHTVAHDLKNPVQFIIVYSEMLVDDYEELSREEIRENAEGIVRGAYKMENIIENLLLLAGVRKQQVELEPLDMAEVVEQMEHRLASLIQAGQVELIVPSDDAWPVAWGYAPWVEEVWVNYVSNAIKYGGDPPRVRLGAAPQSDGQVRFWVQDDGPGISPEAQARLFIPFERLDQVGVKGHGLGLSIVRRIVEKLGGQVGVESAPGEGSTFYFSLPGEE